MNEYDQIKGLLNKMRSLNETKKRVSNIIVEQEEPLDTQVDNNATKEQYDNIEVINDVEVKLLSTDKGDTELRQDEKNTISQLIDSFRQEVSQMSELDPGIVITEKQVRLDGNDTEVDVNFTFIVGEDMGLYITSEMALVNEGMLDFITKLDKFWETFKTSVEPLIRERKLM
jgi:hypothetical protein